MTPALQDALLTLSTFYHPEPEEVFQRILELITQQYGQTMAMINLQEGERLRYRAAANLHPALRGLDSLELERTY